ncbi:MAG TPA: class I SAM-dependent methyltransferase [Candidatus Bathyarchaeia archaeon]|nr:class I SAM-dependent methyltransferase [Candidatus Bathyarchaeia archaeon]
MDEKILRVLNRLGQQSKLERSGDLKVVPEDEMLAITPDTGIFFKIILNAMHAKRILEIGTSVGYSTLWFADAVIQNGITKAEGSKPIITIDINHSKIEKATKNFHDAEVDSLIKVVEDSALNMLQEMSNNFHREKDIKKTDGLFDFVFFDADKENLRDYFDLVIPMLRVGGIVATDNMLYPEDYRLLMLNYASYVRSKPYIQSVTVPIGNGEEITIKLAPN